MYILEIRTPIQKITYTSKNIERVYKKMKYYKIKDICAISYTIKKDDKIILKENLNPINLYN